MLRTVWGTVSRCSFASLVCLFATILPSIAEDRVLDLSAFSIDKISHFTPKGTNNKFMMQVPHLTQPKVILNPGDALVLKLSKVEGRSEYGPCHLESMVSDRASKSILSVGDDRYVAIGACEEKIVVFPQGPGLGLITSSMDIPIQVTALSSQQEEALLKTVRPAEGTLMMSVSADTSKWIKSEIGSTISNIYKVVIKNRRQLLHSYMFVLARRDGKNCLPFLASLTNADADAEAKAEALSCIKMLTNGDYSKSQEKSTQSWESWWQLHAAEYGASSH